MRKTVACVIVGAVVLVSGAALSAAGARINTTPSIPVGLYWTTHDPLLPGVFVQVCPDRTPLFDEALSRGYIRAGFCGGRYGYLMKRVLAAKNDRVSIDSLGVAVNSHMIPKSAPATLDKLGRPLPQYQLFRTLNAAELVVMSDGNSAGFDSRYFGPIDRSQVVSVLRPVFVW